MVDLGTLPGSWTTVVSSGIRMHMPPAAFRARGATLKVGRGFDRFASDAASARRRLTLVGGEPTRAAMEPVPALPGVLSEELFRSVLSRERKRADRFDDVFALVTVGLGRRPEAGPSLADLVAAALNAARRGADVVGWVKHREVLGIIVTDLGAAAEGVSRQVQDRMQNALAERIPASMFEHLAIDCYLHLGPARWSEGASGKDPLLQEIHAVRQRRSVLNALKRALDVVGSAAMLFLMCPLLLVIAALIRLTSAGPVLFRQVRVGQFARPFTILKFRTMIADADCRAHQEFVSGFIRGNTRELVEASVPFKLTGDPRVTPIGRVLRRFSLDELPQLWNVLAGDMSLVGPRPPLPYEVALYRSWHWRRVLEAKPGLTGLWQVTGRSQTTFDDMVRLDLRYASSPSLWTDVRIIAATARAVVTGRGAV